MKSKNKYKKTSKLASSFDMRNINTRILLCFLAFTVIIFVSFWIGTVLFMSITNETVTIENIKYISEPNIILIFLYITLGALVICAGMSWWLSYMLANPIEKLSIAAKRVASGEKNVNFNIKGYTEIDELSESLSFMNEKMLQTDALRRDLLANVSHDLRTPLTIIKAYAEMIKDVSGDNKIKREQQCTVIIDEADRLTNLVQDILDLSKIEAAGATIMKMDNVNISELTSHAAEKFHYLVEQGEYEIFEDIEEGLTVIGDEKRLEQVLYNLIANAIYYTGDDHKVYISVKKTPKNRARVEIKDTGKGISDEDKVKVWQRYYRSAATGRREAKGTGLGLTVVKTILEAHRAHFGINSVVGCGSTFYFEL